MQSDRFPCSALPSSPSDQKLLGIYPQAQDGRWLQRVKITGGRLYTEGWRLLANLAQQYSPTTPLHLTTRQDLELHDLEAVAIPQIQHELAKVGLTTFGTAGDTFRNITVCPCCGLRKGSIDLMPWAQSIDSVLSQLDGIYELPRKFKVDLACSMECGRPFMHDVGLVLALDQNGDLGFKVILAGSLGVNPATGILWQEWIPCEDVLPIIVAVVQVFAEHGDRENRRRARLRHVRQRVGDEAFCTLIQDSFQVNKTDHSWPTVQPSLPQKTQAVHVVLRFYNGDISVASAQSLARLTARSDIYIRISIQHEIHVFSKDHETLQKALDEEPALTPARQAQPTIIACPGQRWCKHGLGDTNRLADRIRLEVADEIPEGTAICISGCPNGCSLSRIADVGFSARTNDTFDVYIHGGMGRTPDLATLDKRKLTVDDAIDYFRRK